MKYLDTNNILFDESQSKHYVEGLSSLYLKQIVDEIDLRVKEVISKKGGVSTREIKSLIRSIIRKHYNRWVKFGMLDHFPRNFVERFAGSCRCDGRLRASRDRESSLHGKLTQASTRTRSL